MTTVATIVAKQIKSAQVKAEYWKTEQQFCESMINFSAQAGDLFGVQVAMDNFERANEEVNFFTKQIITLAY